MDSDSSVSNRRNDQPAAASDAYVAYRANEYRAYAKNNELTDDVIPDGVTEIGEKAFFGCESLKSIVIPDRVAEIGIAAFSGCGGLESIVIPDRVTEIGKGAFSRCSHLKSIVIPNSVEEIGEGAFSCCWNLETIVYRGKRYNYKTDRKAFKQDFKDDGFYYTLTFH